MATNEILPLVDEQGNIIGSAERSRCHSPEKLLHPVVHLHVIDSQGRILLQLRSMTKKIQPGKWDTAVGGHVDFGESIEAALHREVSEEIGLHEFIPEKVATYLFESEVERELINSYVARVSSEFVPQVEPTDIDELRFFTIREVELMIAQGLTTPNFAREFTDLILPRLKAYD